MKDSLIGINEGIEELTLTLLTLVNVLTNMNKQWTMHLLHYLLIFVNVS